MRLSSDPEHSIHRRQQFTQRERERRRWRLDRLRRQPGPRESRAALLGHSRQVIRDLPHLLILEQAPDQFRARIFPRFIVLVPRQQKLRLDAQQASRHLEVLGGLVDRQRLDPRQELFGDARDRDVVDVDLLVADQRQQQVEGALELLKFDDERFARLRRGGHPIPIA